eukprot:364398-Chlamydomonas_euryale.AAC.24
MDMKGLGRRWGNMLRRSLLLRVSRSIAERPPGGRPTACGGEQGDEAHRGRGLVSGSTPQHTFPLSDRQAFAPSPTCAGSAPHHASPIPIDSPCRDAHFPCPLHPHKKCAVSSTSLHVPSNP